MDKIKSNTNWHSSYEANNYGDLFYALIRLYQPKIVVELGTQAGYSAYHIARGLTENGHGKLDCYDLWEKNNENYGFNSISRSIALNNLKQYKNIISLNSRNAIEVDKKYQMIDILHVDLDNDATILEKVVPAWISKVKQLIIIEGGSIERDIAAEGTDFKKLPVNEWLNDLDRKDNKNLRKLIEQKSKSSSQYVVVSGKAKYKEKPIAPWLKDFSKRQGNIEYFTFEPFPSLTIMRKKP